MNVKEAKIHGHGGTLSRYQNYLGEFVYGGIDGSVTTFAVVAAASGGNLDSTVVIILGFANLLADGFAMSVGSYLSTKSEQQNYDKHKRIEYWEIENLPQKEIDEVREIYEKYGFEGQLLDDIVAHMTADKDRWVEVMMREELEMMPEDKSPIAMGGVTFGSFLLWGLIPLIIFLIDAVNPLSSNLFLVSSIMTFVAFACIGLLKGIVTQTSRLRSVIETLFLGGAAAALAYYIGDLLEQII